MNPPAVTIGGQNATVDFAGLVPPFAHLYQLNVVVPASLADGDQAVVALVNCVTSPASSACCFITVQR